MATDALKSDRTPSSSKPRQDNAPAAPRDVAGHAPRNETERMFSDFVDIFFADPFGSRPWFPDSFKWPGPMAAAGLNPRVDVSETGTAWEIAAELPGMREADIEIAVDGDLLTLKGEKSEQKKDERKNYHMAERRYGSFQRSFRLPGGIDRDRISARFDNGVLSITLPKSAEAQNNRKIIPIGKN